jgi:hypothetical protein
VCWNDERSKLHPIFSQSPSVEPHLASRGKRKNGSGHAQPGEGSPRQRSFTLRVRNCRHVLAEVLFLTHILVGWGWP